MWKLVVTVLAAFATLGVMYFMFERICALEREHHALTRELSRVTEVLEQEQARSLAIERSVVQIQASAARRTAELREYEHGIYSSDDPLVNQCVPDELLRGLRSYRPKDGGVKPDKGADVPANASGDTGVP